ncbi:hypothetical protein Y1Q_0024636 [Alligator mississippiensis]|uniref:Uncharacterized protein n=1 Tax=Alligator mississippiensis TaxID=8496 RepID=A0A151NB88_ALLMI|nr:hypothetical protein Y1Q_0024636 [Alligator mississippiensis]
MERNCYRSHGKRDVPTNLTTFNVKGISGCTSMLSHSEEEATDCSGAYLVQECVRDYCLLYLCEDHLDHTDTVVDILCLFRIV